MNKAKLKEPHSSAEIEIILFEFSDIVTASGAVPPPLDNMDTWT